MSRLGWHQKRRNSADGRDTMGEVVLDGESAVSCNPQSATAGLNSSSRVGPSTSGSDRGIDSWALRGGAL
jgi:hypothetical protein